MIMPAIEVAITAQINTRMKFRWMPIEPAGAEERTLIFLGEEELRGKPTYGVGPNGVERHVPEVQEPGKADHDVQPQRHDHVGQGHDRRLQETARHRR